MDECIKCDLSQRFKNPPLTAINTQGYYVINFNNGLQNKIYLIIIYRKLDFISQFNQSLVQHIEQNTLINR